MPGIETELQNGVLRIALNRPEKKNAITSAMYTELASAFEAADQSSDTQVLLLHGKGDSFTAGNDLVDFLQNPWKDDPHPPAERWIRAVAAATKPVVAAVQGACVGIGATILLHCDLVYAAESLKLMMPFVSLGIVPEAGSSLLLPALVGHQRASELLMLGATLSGTQARDWGLLNAVVPEDCLMPTAMQAAQTLAAKPASALRQCKQMLKKNYAAHLDAVISEEVAAVRQRLDSPETREALSAFLEKRQPDFSRLR